MRHRRWGELTAAVVSLLVIAALYYLCKPNLYEATSFGHAVFDRNGKLLRLALADDGHYRLFVPLDGIAPIMQEATLLYEDRNFYWHPGVNPVALVSATWDTLVNARRRGGSTITMQLARMRFAIDSRSVVGKLHQVARAIHLELYYSKAEILEAYFNMAPYGGNVEGVGAAARVYFNKAASQLTLAESLALSVVPQKPGARAPDLEGREPVGLLEARQLLAHLWLKENSDAVEEGLSLTGPLNMRRRSHLPFLAPHFSQTVIDHSPPGNHTTTLDWALQDILERRAATYIERNRHLGITNTAILLVDHRSMEVLAALGSADFGNVGIEGQVNGIRAKRSPGSALKPFIYALAVEAGIIHPRTLLADAPMRFGAYNPENFDDEFVGPISASDALIRSRNVPAVYLETQLRANCAKRPECWEHGATSERLGALPTHPGGLYDLLRRARIDQLEPSDHYGLAVVLGGVEVTMEELVQLYAMLANGGVYQSIRYDQTADTSVHAPVDNSVKESSPAGDRRLLSREAAYVTVEMLAKHQRPHQGFASDWTGDDIRIAWKTGTSSGFRDAWAVGIIGPYVLAVWVGSFDNRGNPSYVSLRASTPLFFEIAEALRPYAANFQPPKAKVNVSKVHVCSVSGMLPNAHCPRTEPTLFIPGISPIASCDIHREVRVYPTSGLRVCPGDESDGATRVYEFWPSDLNTLFVRAGLPRRAAPPFAESCGLDARAIRGRPPVITSPQSQVTYNLRANNVSAQTVPLSAVTDADAHALSWFVNDELVGHSPTGQPLFWNARPGHFVVRVVDDNGRSDSLDVVVEMVQ
ncbi:MAG: hypothetical protein A2289_15315 [Deltaproteobacteria bacterium RIFOXYA12_FULL_58_15]|nr:MAG: hypothetical protein A2289_15315 [Deltaproteobacteria bacterium RIFOXYA12_FULL_58_15]OGR13850.1 MAG: hypothetical protein A2341_01520 [Deltaproteobacteria bacterium RIFOXYB12_FULL_58_9]